MGVVILKDRVKRIWLLSIDAVTVLILLLFNVSAIIVIGVALTPVLLWRVLFGTKKEIARYNKEGLKHEEKDNEQDKLDKLEIS